MKKFLLSILSVAVFTGVSAQCNEIFISEYVEGWSTNKAIELYNPTSSPINLSAYQLKRYSNGSPTASGSAVLTLSGTIPAKGIFVIVLDKRDTAGTGVNAPVWDSLQAKADVFACPVYRTNKVMYFNGDDAMVLTKGSVLVDVIGKVGERPVGGWGSGQWTKDHTMIRKASIQQGDVIPNDAFDPATEWDSLPANTFDSLRHHTCSCGNANSISEKSINTNFKVFPNPSNSGSINILTRDKAVSYKVINVVGTLIETKEINNKEELKISTLNWEKGIYFISLDFGNGILGTKKVIVN